MEDIRSIRLSVWTIRSMFFFYETSNRGGVGGGSTEIHTRGLIDAVYKTWALPISLLSIKLLWLVFHIIAVFVLTYPLSPWIYFKNPMGWIPHPAQDLEELWDINPSPRQLVKLIYYLSSEAEDRGGGLVGGGDIDFSRHGPNPNKGGEDQTEHRRGIGWIFERKGYIEHMQVEVEDNYTITFTVDKFPSDPVSFLFDCLFSAFLDACLLSFDVITINKFLWHLVLSHHWFRSLRSLFFLLVLAGPL